MPLLAIPLVAGGVTPDGLQECEALVPGAQVGNSATPRGVYLDSGETMLLFPQGHLYPLHIADPHRTGAGIETMVYSDTEVAESGNERFGLKAGARVEVLRVHPLDHPDLGWQLSVEGGFDAQFDRDHSLDNIGWDGNYGFLASTARSGGVALMLGIFHVSSHVGDEYAERTGRQRIGYTRGEIASGISLRIAKRWRTYAEAGWGYELRNERLQEPGRIQFGVEFENPRSIWARRLGWYAALDASSMQERGWKVDTCVQVGMVTRSGNRVCRWGIERYHGRVPIGEFFEDSESYTALGFWLDF